jgi:hypothetical protein
MPVHRALYLHVDKVASHISYKNIDSCPGSPEIKRRHELCRIPMISRPILHLHTPDIIPRASIGTVERVVVDAVFGVPGNHMCEWRAIYAVTLDETLRVNEFGTLMAGEARNPLTPSTILVPLVVRTLPLD